MEPVENLLSDRPGKWHFSWVATRGGCPIGYAIVSQREHGVHLHHIVMGHAWRSRGVGLKLLWFTANKAVESGIGILTLKVYDNNKRAIAFYERLSFRNSGRLPTEELIEMTIDTQALMDACAERIRWSAWRTDSHNETVNETVMKP